MIGSHQTNVLEKRVRKCVHAAVNFRHCKRLCASFGQAHELEGVVASGTVPAPRF